MKRLTFQSLASERKSGLLGEHRRRINERLNRRRSTPIGVAFEQSADDLGRLAPDFPEQLRPHARGRNPRLLPEFVLHHGENFSSDRA